ncbi:SRPBCC family protein [Nonomuraea roseoviolacea]|uniref:SRPBCC family protein n=1 Tax=Nonomuraea roseoviolacea TaxID=103837 RepID=UPI0031D9CA79
MAALVVMFHMVHVPFGTSRCDLLGTEILMRTSTTIAAPVSAVWTVLLDIERWPDWTGTVTTARWLDPGPTRPGRRARLTQPRLGGAEWEITELDQERSFTWARRSAGVTTVGGHLLSASPEGGTILTLSIDHSGPLAGVVRLLTDRLTRRYIDAEAHGLKAYCER